MVVAPPPADLDIEHLEDAERTRWPRYEYYERGRLRVLADPGHEAADDRLRARRLAGRAGGVDRREVPHVDRLRRRRRASLHQGPAARQHHAVLAHAHRPLGRAPLLRGRPDRGFVPDHEVEVPVGVAAFPQGDHPLRPGAGPSSATTSSSGPRCREAATSRRSRSPTCWSATCGSSSAPYGSTPEPPGPSTFSPGSAATRCASSACASRRVAGQPVRLWPRIEPPSVARSVAGTRRRSCGNPYAASGRGPGRCARSALRVPGARTRRRRPDDVGVHVHRVRDRAGDDRRLGDHARPAPPRSASPFTPDDASSAPQVVTPHAARRRRRHRAAVHRRRARRGDRELLRRRRQRLRHRVLGAGRHRGHLHQPRADRPRPRRRPRRPGPWPFTGSNDTPSYVLIGVAAVVIGLVFVVAARRRRQV